jgi:hypothetical protein
MVLVALASLFFLWEFISLTTFSIGHEGQNIDFFFETVNES